MIYISIGIALLAIGSIVLTHRQTQIEINKAYQKGFADGARVIALKKYQRLEQVEREMKKD